MKSSMALLVTLLAIAPVTFADNPVIINNNYPQQQSNQAEQGNHGNTPPCNNHQADNSGPPPGTYYQSNPHGGTDTVYSTGNKQPYIVDNNCNNVQNPIIEPNVYPPNSPSPQAPIIQR
jgi:hypothetical protein